MTIMMLVIVIMTMTIVPIVITLVGIVTDVSAIHDWKALLPDDNDDSNDSSSSNRCQSDGVDNDKDDTNRGSTTKGH